MKNMTTVVNTAAWCVEVVKRLSPESSHLKEKFSFVFSFYYMMDAN